MYYPIKITNCGILFINIYYRYTIYIIYIIYDVIIWVFIREGVAINDRHGFVYLYEYLCGEEEEDGICY